MFFVNEDVSTFDQAGSFSIVGTACDVIEGATEAGFEKKESILCGRDMAIESRLKW